MGNEKRKSIAIIVLGVITLCEIFYLNQLTESIWFWVGYGIYRGIKYLTKNDMW